MIIMNNLYYLLYDHEMKSDDILIPYIVDSLRGKLFLRKFDRNNLSCLVDVYFSIFQLFSYNETYTILYSFLKSKEQEIQINHPIIQKMMDEIPNEANQIITSALSFDVFSTRKVLMYNLSEDDIMYIKLLE